jgi:hypothetical protein
LPVASNPKREDANVLPTKQRLTHQPSYIEIFNDLDRDSHESTIKFEERNKHWKVAA